MYHFAEINNSLECWICQTKKKTNNDKNWANCDVLFTGNFEKKKGSNLHSGLYLNTNSFTYKSCIHIEYLQMVLNYTLFCFKKLFVAKVPLMFNHPPADIFIFIKSKLSESSIHEFSYLLFIFVWFAHVHFYMINSLKKIGRNSRNY